MFKTWEIASLQMMYILKTIDLNTEAFNEDIGFHIFPDFGLESGYLKSLLSKIKGGGYHNVDLICDWVEIDLDGTLTFQKNLTKTVIFVLENCFKNNDVIGCFKIWGLTKIPI